MNKRLFNLGLFLLVANFMLAQNKSSQLSAPVKARTVAGSQKRASGPQAAPTTTVTDCMSINYPTVTGWSPSIYTTGTGGANGFMSGVNSYDDREKAMYFNASASSFTNLYQVDVWFAKAYSTTPSKVVTMKIYDGTSGTPAATAIASASVTIGSIMSDVAGNYNTSFYFPAGVTLPASKKFFCSVDISALNWSTSKDTLAIVSNQSGQTNPAAAWEKQSNNTWYQYNNASAWGTGGNMSLYIHPFLRNTPVVATFAASTASICAGKSITFDATGSTTGGLTYWSFGAASPNTATTTIASATYSAAGTYTTTLLVFDACETLGAAQGTISVKANPTVSASPSSTTVCSGAMVTLNGNGAVSYAWSGGVNNGVAFTAVAGAYTVTGTAANGCTNTAVANVGVNALPVVTANTTATAVCTGNNVTLTGGGATTYTWTGGVNNGVAFAPTSTDTYTVTGTDANGCTNTAIESVTVNSLPNVTANTTASAVCEGANITLTGGGATTYAWSGSINNGSAFAPASTDTYTVTGTDANGCQNTAVVSVTVNTLPNVMANTTASVVCAGSNVTLSGTGASTYTWSGSVNDGAAFAPVSTDSYTVTGTDANGCENTAVVSVSVNTLPVVTANASATMVCTGDNVILTGGGATTYTWSGSVTDGVAFVPTATDTYTVSGEDANGCAATATVEVVVDLCTGIKNASKSSGVMIYPNPSNGSFTIHSLVNETISIVNELGQIIDTAVLNHSNNFSYKAENMQSGVYFVIGTTSKTKVVVTR